MNSQRHKHFISFMLLYFWRASDIHYSVRLSVRHVPVFYRNGLTSCHNFFTKRQPDHSSFIRYNYQTYSRNSDGVTHFRGVKYRLGIIFFAIFDPNGSLYLANDTRWRRRRRIGSSTQAFESSNGIGLPVAIK